MDYVTVAEVDVLLGAGWDESGNPARAVLLANAWLRQHLRADVGHPTPQAVLHAGAEIARAAGQGLLFRAEPREVLSTTVSAGEGVSTSKTFAKGSSARSAGETLALALIAPWRRRAGTFMLRRV